VRMDGATIDIAQFPVAAVTRLAGRLGVEPADFRIDGMTPVSPAMNRHWAATAAYLAGSFAGPDPAVAHPLVLNAVVDAVAAAVLTVFPNTTMRVDHTTGPGRAAPAVVRRAVAFIDAHAAEPITLEDIAAASGIKVRGLQAAFARHRDTTPMGYLRRVRMERAHRDLQAGDRAGGDSVTATARRWGFGSPGRFAAEYRRLYGRPPGETLES
jgi:AraC-like DNA-binding protein